MANKAVIILLESIAPVAHKLLKDYTVIEAFDFNVEPFIHLPIEGIITRGRGQVRKTLIDRCPHLKCIGRCGIGLDNIDVEYAQAKGIQVLNAPGSNAQTVAEHTIALLLNVVRETSKYRDFATNGQWVKRNEYDGDEIFGKKIGIVGLGNIGKKVAAIATAFGLQVLYFDKFKQDVPYPFCDLQDLLRQSDIITVHVELNSETTEMFNANTISMLQPHVTIINMARSGLFDTNALIIALKEQKIKNYAADVAMPYEVEPYTELLSLPNAYITPHISSLTKHTYDAMCSITVNKVLGVIPAN